MQCKTYPGADCDPDHTPVIMNMIVKLKKLKKSKQLPKLQLELLRLNNDYELKYVVKIINKFNAL